MEVYFLDVGQGTSQVLLLGNRRAFVIDCGERDTTLMHLLASLGIQEIAGLALSHSHDDHRGAAETVLSNYEGLIDCVYFLQDSSFFDGLFWARVSDQIQSGALDPSRLVRLERGGAPKEIFRDRNLSLKLKLCSPTAAENLHAQANQSPNSTSAVLLLEVGQSRVLFPGDATIEQWRRIHAESGRRLDCDIVAVPHHAGNISDDPADLDWLYTDCVRPRIAVVSVGTSNTYKHPKPAVIASLRKAGATVLSTQITGQCCDKLESLRPGVLRPLRQPCRSRPSADLTGGGNSRNVACAATVVAQVEANSVSIDRLDAHQAAVDKLAAGRSGAAVPLCRR